MFLFKSCQTSTVLFGQSIGQQALISGISDVIAVKYPNGIYRSTPFLVCFGSHAILNRQQEIQIEINEKTIINTKNKVNRHGYMKNVFMTQLQMQKMDLQWGRNKIKYILNQYSLEAQIWLLKITDRILISDFDGTVTVTDFGGLMGGVLDFQIVHPGYPQLMKKLSQHNVFLIWVTMRSLPFYNISKKYITKYLNSDGIMLMQPQQFLPAVKKQLFKKTGNIKANIIKTIALLFPPNVYPFVGGLGNRQNDAIAYLNIGMKMQNIYLVSSSSHVQRMSSKQFGLTYKMMAKKVHRYFDLQNKNLLTIKDATSKLKDQKQTDKMQRKSKSLIGMTSEGESMMQLNYNNHHYSDNNSKSCISLAQNQNSNIKYCNSNDNSNTIVYFNSSNPIIPSNSSSSQNSPLMPINQQANHRQIFISYSNANPHESIQNVDHIRNLQRYDLQQQNKQNKINNMQKVIVIKDEKKLASSLSLLSSQKFTSPFANNGNIKKV